MKNCVKKGLVNKLQLSSNNASLLNIIHSLSNSASFVK